MKDGDCTYCRGAVKCLYCDTEMAFISSGGTAAIECGTCGARGPHVPFRFVEKGISFEDKDRAFSNAKAYHDRLALSPLLPDSKVSGSLIKRDLEAYYAIKDPNAEAIEAATLAAAESYDNTLKSYQKQSPSKESLESLVAAIKVESFPQIGFFNGLAKGIKIAKRTIDPSEPEHPYHALHAILQNAFEDSASGKGVERHVDPGKKTRWVDQPIITNTVMTGFGGPLYQAIKKADEGARFARAGNATKALREFHGAIVYLAATIYVVSKDLPKTSGKDRPMMPGDKE